MKFTLRMKNKKENGMKKTFPISVGNVFLPYEFNIKMLKTTKYVLTFQGLCYIMALYFKCKTEGYREQKTNQNL